LVFARLQQRVERKQRLFEGTHMTMSKEESITPQHRADRRPLAQFRSHANFDEQSVQPGAFHSLESGYLESTPVSNIEIIRLARLEEMTGLKRSSIYNRLNPRSQYYDSTFPSSIDLSAGSKRSSAIGFVKSEVLAWLQARIQARDSANSLQARRSRVIRGSAASNTYESSK
jgi:prophage regulatory protein